MGNVGRSIAQPTIGQHDDGALGGQDPDKLGAACRARRSYEVEQAGEGGGAVGKNQ